jgi:hypothetical protein
MLWNNVDSTVFHGRIRWGDNVTFKICDYNVTRRDTA